MTRSKTRGANALNALNVKTKVGKATRVIPDVAGSADATEALKCASTEVTPAITPVAPVAPVAPVIGIPRVGPRSARRAIVSSIALLPSPSDSSHTGDSPRVAGRRSVNIFNGGFQVDTSLPRDKRPLTALDLDEWRKVNSFRPADAVYFMGLTSVSNFQNHMKSPEKALSMSTELLLRAYLIYPSPPPWGQVDIERVYMTAYHEVLEAAQAEGDAAVQRVRKILYRRFPVLFGRQVSSTYRWFGRGAEPTSSVTNLVQKLHPDREGFMDRLEAISIPSWSLRGLDFNKEYPHPDHPEAGAEGANPPAPVATRNASKGPPAPAKTPKRSLQIF
jgi:hypothetical protein